MELILVVGYSRSEFRELLNTAPAGVTYEYAESSAVFEDLLRSKEYSCIFCSKSVPDSISYVYAMRNIQMTPIIVGEPRHYRNINSLKYYVDVVLRHKSVIEAGTMQLDFDRRMVSVRKHEIKLTATEFDILSLLISNPNRVFTYSMIVDVIWNEDYTFYSKKVIHNHVSNINKKTRVAAPDHKYIVSIHGIGYKFVAG